MDESEHDERADWWESPLGPEGCLFPGECCMPGPHYTTECHTAQMLMDLEQRLKESNNENEKS